MPSKDASDLGVALEHDSQTNLASLTDSDEDTKAITTVSDTLSNEMQDSLLFKCNWAELLHAAPTALSCMGACFAAASSDKAVVKFTDRSKFKYLSHESIQANLVECATLGLTAFITAEENMGKISQTSTTMNDTINQMCITLSNPMTAKRLLRIQLETIKSAAEMCHDAAAKMDEDFEAWLMYICELHAACVQEDQTTVDVMLSNEACLAAASNSLDRQKDIVALTQKTTELLQKQLEMTGEAFKNASNSFPSGWDLVGQQVVGELSHCVTNGLNAAIPALVDSFTTAGQVKMGSDIVGGFLDKVMDSGDEDDDKGHNRGSKDSDTSDGTKTGSTRPGQPVSQKSFNPPDIQDPAYDEATRMKPTLIIYKSMFDEVNGGINWDIASGKGQEGGRGSIEAVVKCLTTSQTALEDLDETDTKARLGSIVTDLMTVAVELQTEVKNTESHHNHPGKNDKAVTSWHERFLAAYHRLTKMQSANRSRSGAYNTGGGVMGSTTDPAPSSDISASSSQGQALLQASKDRMLIAQEALNGTQTAYLKATESLIAQQQLAIKIQNELESLKKTALTLAEIKQILFNCIKLIINLKQQVTNLLRFFKALVVAIDVAAKLHIEPFIKTVKALTAADEDPNKAWSVGGYTWTTVERSMVWNSALIVKAYFGVFGDIARMWIDLSIAHIMPGLKLVNDVGVTDAGLTPEAKKSAIDEKVRLLEQWSTKASKAVETIATEKQNAIKKSMNGRIAAIAATTEKIQVPLPKPHQDSIKNGVGENTKAAEKGLEEKKESTPLKIGGRHAPAVRD